MKNTERIDAGEERAERSVWICPECFDAYKRQTPDGVCPNPGHAAVKLIAVEVRELPSVETELSVIAAEQRKPMAHARRRAHRRGRPDLGRKPEAA